MIYIYIYIPPGLVNILLVYKSFKFVNTMYIIFRL